MDSQTTRSDVVLTPAQLLAHWQGHRRLSRRVIEAFPEDKLFEFSVGGMRPLGQLAFEMLSMAEPSLREMAGGPTQDYRAVLDGITEGITKAERPKEELLRRWDASTAAIDELWRKIPASRFQERLNCFGAYEGPVYDLLFYVIDNEIHHRAQGYVYLRALGIEPPHFWER